MTVQIFGTSQDIVALAVGGFIVFVSGVFVPIVTSKFVEWLHSRSHP